MKELNELVKIDDNNKIVLKEDVVKKIEDFNNLKKEIEEELGGLDLVDMFDTIDL